MLVGFLSKINMKKYLIISDIHGRPFWEKPINAIINKNLDVERIIFLGDYFDPYPQEGISEESAITNWMHLKSKVVNNLSPNQYVFLIGNHDAHYINNTFRMKCGGSRMSIYNFNTFQGIFKDNKFLFQMAHEENINGKKVLFTHAGINQDWLERHNDIIEDVNANTIIKLTESEEGWDALSDVGHIRGGYQKTGSPLWADVNENNGKNGSLKDVYGIDYQVFGHTQQQTKPIINDNYAMLDCRKAFIIDDDLTINEFAEV